MLRFAEDWETMDGFKLYRLGLDPDIEWDPRILDRLIEVGDGGDLYWAGLFWSDDRYDPRILDRLIEVGDGWHLYVSGLYWKDDRYDSRIAQALIDTKDMRYIRAALGEEKLTSWPPERIRDLLMTWQGIGEDNA